MFSDKLRSFFRTSGDSPPNGVPVYMPQGGRISRPQPRTGSSGGTDRTSNGVRQFFDNLKGGGRLSILDLGGVCQANVNFIALRGHKLYTEDLFRSLERLVPLRDPAAGRNGRATHFLQESFNFPAEHFDGVLVWDTLEFLDEELLGPAVARLHSIVKPGGTLLAFFHTQAKGEAVAVYRYEIRDHQTLHLQPRCVRPLPRAFNNRNLERLFSHFRSVKFFLAKDGLREVIVTR